MSEGHTTWRCLTPPGLAAVTVLGLQGAVERLPLHAASGARVSWPRRGGVRRARLVDAGQVIDEVLVLRGNGDGSDAAELHLHGGDGVRYRVVGWLEQHDVHHAKDVVPCQPVSSLRLARARLSARDGPLANLTRRARAIRSQQELTPELRSTLARSLALATHAQRLEQVAIVRLVGRPNAGKSTLFNAMLGRERALVSPLAGTTRDMVCATFELHGVPVVLQDTAGAGYELRPPRHADVASTAADLVVHLLSDPGEQPFEAGGPVPVLRVLGRADERDPSSFPAASGRTGSGVGELVDAIADRLGIVTQAAADVLAPLGAERRRMFADVLAIGRSGPACA